MSHPAENMRRYRLEELIYYGPLARGCESKVVQPNTVAEGNICPQALKFHLKIKLRTLAGM